MSRKLAIAVASILLVFTAAVWLASRETTLIWVVNHVAQRSGGTLTVSGVKGSLLFGPIGFAKIAYRTSAMELSAEQGRIEFARWPLLKRNLILHRLDVDSIVISRHAIVAAEPAKPPERLQLPMQATIDELRINHIALVPADVSVGPLASSAQITPQAWSAQ